MELRFDPRQEFQLRAVESVIGLLEGQPNLLAEATFTAGGIAVAPNRLDLGEELLLANLRQVQTQNGLSQDNDLIAIEEEIETPAGRRRGRFLNFSVEMETGTGKTYVYIRTALELNRRYGLTKFIIVVPSIAIKEGVLKTLLMTRDHFGSLFERVPYSYYAYDGERLSQVRQFARSSAIQFLVMTLDAFNKASNRINKMQDALFGSIPIQELQAARPILILDEPQNMATDLAKKALASLDPLFALRYSATHREPFNVVYRLTPYEAYRQGLVKKIAVASIVKEGDANQVFLRLESIEAKGNRLSARIAVHKRLAKGEIAQVTVTVRDKDELEATTGRPEYRDFKVAEISKVDGYVRFTNNVELVLGESRGGDRTAILREQIRYTVREHLRRQERLRSHRIKVLSLFFVDSVDNYAPDGSPLKRMFAEAFDEYKQAYPEWSDKSPQVVQAAYFAERKRKGGTEFVESSGATEADQAAYRLIMQNKEELLSFANPTAFIFSHSALREGWDNPNVFFVCTLRQVGSEMQRRQQVGRGMRLAVNQEGDRVRDDGVNLLTVVANEAYERYVEGLQAEIAEDYGTEGLPPKPVRANQASAKLQKERQLSPEFQALWERIRQRTRYAITIDSADLLNDGVAALSAIQVSKPRITITRAEVDVDSEDALFARRGGSDTVDVTRTWPLPDLVGLMADVMEHTTPPVKLTKRTLLQLIRRLPNPQMAIDNPQEFATVAVARLKKVLADRLVSGVHYEPIGQVWEMTLFEEEWEEFMETVACPERSLYDHVFVQSGVEREFALKLDRMKQVRIFLKLPRWFEVETPVGRYNPDWAVVWEDMDAGGRPTGQPHLYLVAETKGDSLGGRSLEEQQKVACGMKHFERLKVPYYVVQSADDLVRRLDRSAGVDGSGRASSP